MAEQEVQEAQPIEDVRTDQGESEVAPLGYVISSYGADYTVDGLVKRMRDGSVYVPEFQRGFVWDVKDASRFVESLLLGLPVPSIFLSKEADTGKLLVVDGQQRLLSLRYFYDGIWEPNKREFSLRGVDPTFEGRTYKKLREEDRRRLDDAILHVTIFKQDEPSEDLSGIYQVFERLNSGGKKLTPQEIRSAVHHSGGMRKLLEELNANRDWRAIYGQEDGRMRDQELVLRFLAFYYESDGYKSPLVSFLNSFMGRHKDLGVQEAADMRKVFSDTIHTIHEVIGTGAFRPIRALNAAVFDSVMVGLARRLQRGPLTDDKDFKAKYEALLKNQEFLDACGRGTAGEERVKTRIGLASQAFAEIS
ncbi:MAG: DUF262 domain-containing protein [Candidatus Acidiferrales bacterium]